MIFRQKYSRLLCSILFYCFWFFLFNLFPQPVFLAPLYNYYFYCIWCANAVHRASVIPKLRSTCVGRKPIMWWLSLIWAFIIFAWIKNWQKELEREGRGRDLEKLCNCWREGTDWRKRREKRMGLTPQTTHLPFPPCEIWASNLVI